MSRFGYSKLHKYKSQVARRLFLLRRSSALRGTLHDVKATAATVYWVGDENSDWNNSNNWGASSGAAGGAGVPKTTTHVVIDGDHTHGLVLGGAVQCGNFTLGAAAGQQTNHFDMNGKQLTCSNFVVDHADDGVVILDGDIVCGGTAFTITALHATALAAWTGDITCTGDVVFASAVAIPGTVTCTGDFTTNAALQLARLLLTAGQTATFKESANFTLDAYTTGDWDGTALADVTLVSATPATAWNFVNPASMDVQYIDVTDSNATNAVDATDDCEDGTGNTNWTFV